MNYYCSEKFVSLTVDPERQKIGACCAAEAKKIDITWLQQNPGQMFNDPLFVEERIQMLNNIGPASCNNCWQAEENNLPSFRQFANSTTIYNETYVEPKKIDLKLSKDCNLTCSYCCKEFSTAWLRDVATNGEYFNDPRYKITNVDQVMLKLGQRGIKQSNQYQLIIDELSKYNQVESLMITGGEPFLHNGLTEIVNKFTVPVHFYTGLGVDTARLSRIINTLPTERVTMSISAENIGKLHEFNRYGNSYKNFVNNLEVIKKSGIKYHFYSTISNLTIFGFREFLDIADDNVRLNFCMHPEYLSVGLIDDESKNLIEKTDFGKFNKQIKQAIHSNVIEDGKEKLSIFINEFSKRRSLSLDIFPQTFINWLNT